MKVLNVNSKFILSVLALASFVISCSGGREENTFTGESVRALASVRTAFDQVTLLEEATGVPRAASRVQGMLTDRGAMLSPTGGTAVSSNYLQGSLELASAYCIEAADAAINNTPQKVFPSYVNFRVGPTEANHPESTVIRPLSVHLLERFTGQKAVQEDVDIMVSSIKGFLEQQRTDNNNTTGTRNAMLAACVTAAANFEAILTR